MNASPAIQLDDFPPPPTEEVINGLPVLENYSEMEGSANPATEPTILTKKVQFSIPRDLRPADDNKTNPVSGNDTTDNPVSEIVNTGPLPPSRLREDREKRPCGEAARPTTQSGTTSDRSYLHQTPDGDTSLLENINQQGSPTRRKAATTSASLTPSTPSLPQEFVVNHLTDYGYPHDGEVVFGV